MDLLRTSVTATAALVGAVVVVVVADVGLGVAVEGVGVDVGVEYVGVDAGDGGGELVGDGVGADAVDNHMIAIQSYTLPHRHHTFRFERSRWAGQRDHHPSS